MSTNNTFDKLSLKTILRHLLIYLGAVALIVYFLPRDVKFIYQFDLNKPWRYGQLMATFDFPIYKPDEVIKREQDSIIKHFQPYFSIDASVGNDAISQLRADYQTDLKEVLPSYDYLRHLVNVLNAIYQKGILDGASADRLQQDSTVNLRIINGLEAQHPRKWPIW